MLFLYSILNPLPTSAAVSDDGSYISVVPPEANSNSDEHTDPDCTIPTSIRNAVFFTEISHEKVSNV